MNNWLHRLLSTLAPNEVTPWDSDDIAAALSSPLPNPELLLARNADETVKEANRQIDALLEKSKRPTESQPLFYIITVGRGLLTRLNADKGHILLGFSSEERGKHYLRSVNDTQDESRAVGCSLRWLREKAQPLAGFGITRFALDWCPRCNVCNTVPVESLGDEEAMLTCWATTLVLTRIQYDTYLSLARQKLEQGDYLDAKRLGQQLVAHVDAERPEAHLLLGECGIRLGDTMLVKRKEKILAHFGDEWSNRLLTIKKSAG